MAKEDHVKILRSGVEAWNRWREVNPGISPDVESVNLIRSDLGNPDLSFADLSGVHLSGANLSRADLSGANLGHAVMRGADLLLANLRDANLSRADLRSAVLSGADLSGAELRDACLTDAILCGANLSRVDMRRAVVTRADLRGTNLTRANLSNAAFVYSDLRRAKLTEATVVSAGMNGVILRESDLRFTDLASATLSGTVFWQTAFEATNFRGATGLGNSIHFGPSQLDQRTLEKSGSLPVEFLRNCGLRDSTIDDVAAPPARPSQPLSCLISYPDSDDEFAMRLRSDLWDSGVRCWSVTEKVRSHHRYGSFVHEAIRAHDKILLVLSRESAKSNWVDAEITTALAEERRRSKSRSGSDSRPVVLIPIWLDRAAVKSKMAWAERIRDARPIGKFTFWRFRGVYQKAFDRLLRDLQESA